MASAKGQGDGTPVERFPQDAWSHARLIPTAGIRSEQERERRASSCLLAVMHGVPELGHTLLGELGAPKSPVIETFTEVRFKSGDGKTVIPDGAVVCRRGKRTWTCLVEIKTGTNDLKDEQVSGYLDIARENGFDGVLTISNQITASVNESPISLDGRKLRKVSLWHLSWWRILTEAVVRSRHRGVSDPDQAWILRELIHYLGSEAAGTYGFEDMGEHWVALRKAVASNTLRPSDKTIGSVAERWEQFTQYLCLSLSQELGRTVQASRTPRKQTTPERLDEIAGLLTSDGTLAAALRVPDAAGELQIYANLRSRQTSVRVTVDAPREGRVRSRITWLLRQLEDAPQALIIEARYPYSGSVPASLGEVQADPGVLLNPQDAKREPRDFALTLTRPMGQKRGHSEGSFVRDTGAQTIAFYRDIVQNIKAWQAPAPKIKAADHHAPSDSVASVEQAERDTLSTALQRPENDVVERGEGMAPVQPDGAHTRINDAGGRSSDKEAGEDL